MDPIKQRTAIAEYLGYIDVREYVEDMDNDYLSLMGRKYKKGPLIRIPDYLNDLNAMHKMENHLPLNQRETYMEYLREITGVPTWGICHALAEQRAEAFLKTIGKWE
jgi:hypothetical protein